MYTKKLSKLEATIRLTNKQYNQIIKNYSKKPDKFMIETCSLCFEASFEPTKYRSNNNTCTLTCRLPFSCILILRSEIYHFSGIIFNQVEVLAWLKTFIKE